MSAAYNLPVIRQLLTHAFNAGEIKTLAFDLFPEVYGDFAAGMTKGQMIRAVLDHALSRGRIPDLLNYVKKANPYQYDQYTDRLETTPPIPQPAFGDEQRLQDLQGNIERESELLRAYEEQLTFEDDPRRLLKIQHEIERQKAAIASYRQEAAQMQAALSAAAVADADEVQERLDDIDQKLAALSQQLGDAENRLAAGQQTIRDHIRQQQQTILAHIAAQHRQTLAALVEKMDANQLALTELLLDAADRQQIAQWDAEQLTRLSQQALVNLKRLRQNQPDAAQWQSMLDLLARETGWQQKLKLTLPLIPGIVEFESEMTMDVVPALKQAWQRLADKIRSMRNDR